MTLEELMGLSGPIALLVALTIGLVEAVKRSWPDLDPRWLPLVALIIGTVLSLLAWWSFDAVPIRAVPFAGIMVGLAAVGLFSGGRATLGR